MNYIYKPSNKPAIKHAVLKTFSFLIYQISYFTSNSRHKYVMLKEYNMFENLNILFFLNIKEKAIF